MLLVFKLLIFLAWKCIFRSIKFVAPQWLLKVWIRKEWHVACKVACLHTESHVWKVHKEIKEL